MPRFRIALFVALCLALAVQGVAQARAFALPCGGHGDAGHMQVAVHGDHAVAADAAHDCCDDGDITSPHACKMGGDCQGHTFVPLLSASTTALAVDGVSSPVTRFAKVIVAPLRDRVWRPPAAA